MPLAGVDARKTVKCASEAAAETIAMKRETQLDLIRRAEARRREHGAAAAATDAHLPQAGGQLGHRPPVRAVIGHRNAWLRDKLATRLVAHRVSVLAAFEDGADVARRVAVEQPELVFVEDLLPTLSGLDVLRTARACSPLTLVGVQVLDGSGVPPFIAAGAKAVFTRQIPPADIADELVRCLHADGDVRRVGRRAASRASNGINDPASGRQALASERPYG